ncbi:MAG: carboxymuconolactone decarboxylase family protein [Acidimicrobiales bacterium]
MTAAAGIDLVGPDQAPLLAQPYYLGGDPGPIVAALAHVPELLEVAVAFIGVALGPSAMEARAKELAIVRTSALLECRYCVEAHTPMARDAGLTVEEVRALRGEARLEEVFADPGERALLAWVEALALGRGPVATELREAVAARFGTPVLVELTTLVGATMMLNRFCSALDLVTSPETCRRLEAEGLRWR